MGQQWQHLSKYRTNVISLHINLLWLSSAPVLTYNPWSCWHKNNYQLFRWRSFLLICSESLLLLPLPERRRVCEVWYRPISVWLHRHRLLRRQLHCSYVHSLQGLLTVLMSTFVSIWKLCMHKSLFVAWSFTHVGWWFVNFHHFKMQTSQMCLMFYELLLKNLMFFKKQNKNRKPHNNKII